MRIGSLPIALAATTLSLNASAAGLIFDESGAASLELDAWNAATVSAGVFGPGWQRASQTGATAGAPTGSGLSWTYSGTLAIPGTAGAQLHYTQSVTAQSATTVGFHYDFSYSAVPASTTIQALHVSAALPVAVFAGKSVTIDGKTTALDLPLDYGTTMLYSGTSKGFSVPVSATSQLSMQAAAPVSFLIQDDRAWGTGAYSARFTIDSGAIASGEHVTLDLTLTETPKVDVLFEPTEMVTDTSGWIPFSFAYDQAVEAGSAPDASRLLDAPAGKSGKLKSVGDHFEFADAPGVPVRFFAVNLVAGANFPDHAEADRIAERLARLGVNLVRHHHLDAKWSNPSLIDYSGNTSRKLDEDARERLEYLIAQLRKRGIYTYMDLMVHRVAMSGDGIDSWAEVPAGWKGYSLVDERMIELQKEYATDVLTHVNPHTGVSLANDPGLVLMEVVNENDLFTSSITLEPFKGKFDARYQAWLAAKGLPAGTALDSADGRRFLTEVHDGFYADMIAHVRGLGVTIPMTGTNWSINTSLLLSNAKLDFTDSHGYWDHPQDDFTTFSNVPMCGIDPAYQTGLHASLGFNAVPGRPFFASEWDHPWINAYRAEATPWIIARALVQGWDGMALFSYRHSSGPVDWITGAFETAVDPAYLSFYPAAATMMLRGDLAEAAPTYVKISDPHEKTSVWSGKAWKTSMETARTLTWLENQVGVPQPSTAGATVLTASDSAFPAAQKQAGDPAGQLSRDWEQGLVRIDSPRSQGVVGFPGGKRQELGDLAVTLDNDFASVIVTSVDDQPLASSDRLLLTTVARVENTGQKLERSARWKVKEAGKGPTLVERVTGTVELPARAGTWTAWVLDSRGVRGAAVAVSGNAMTIGAPGAASVWYEAVLTPEPGGDGGAGGDGGMPPGDASIAADGGSDVGVDVDVGDGGGAPASSSDSDSGCGCRAAGGGGASGIVGLLSGVLAALGRKRAPSARRAERGGGAGAGGRLGRM